METLKRSDIHLIWSMDHIADLGANLTRLGQYQISGIGSNNYEKNYK